MIAGAAIASNIDTPTLQAVLEGIRGEVAAHTDRGIVPGYIAPLAQVDPAKFGIVVAVNDGCVLSAGQVGETFSVQTITKVFTLTLALGKIGVKSAAHSECGWDVNRREPVQFHRSART